MNVLAFVLVIFVGVVGVIEIIQSGWKSLGGWALVALAVALVVQFCTGWERTITF